MNRAPRPPQPGRTRLSTRFLVYYAVTYLVLIGALGWFVDRRVRDALIDDLLTGSESVARAARLQMPEQRERLNEWAREIFTASGLRVTIIDLDGVVLGDSHTDPAVMENHASRPEVIAAIQGVVGTDARTSTSTGFDQFYLALPPDDGLILRVSVSESEVYARLEPFRWGILSMFAVVGLIGVFLVALLAGRLAKPISQIRDTTLEIARGDLDRRPQRSSVREIDELGLSISQLAGELGERLAQSKLATETLEVVLGALPQGTVLVAPGESILYANRRAEELLGVIPATLSELTPHPFQTIVRESVGGSGQKDVVVDHGSPARRLRGMATPFAGDDTVLLVIVDVTDSDRVASIRRDFVANASHELKTPVSSIIASAEALTLAVEKGDGSAVGFARNIETSARQLDRLVSDLLDLSRLERDEPKLDRVHLDQLVAEEVSGFRASASSGGIKLAVDLEPATVMGNWRDLSIVIRNLLDNAFRYTADGGAVRISLSPVDNRAVLVVGDSGSGIPTRDLDRIFERFYRVDTARSRRTGGTGLGLSIVKHVVESHGGSVTATSQLNVGSTFTVSLPLV